MIELEISDESIAVIRLGSSGEKYPSLTRERMLRLREVLEEIRSSNRFKAAIFTGPSPEAFCVGADLDEIMEINDFNSAFSASQEGQKIFRLIADLPCVTACAISGAAVGGGFELALHCDYRIASDTAVVGLPEVKLGIIPGFGGTQRLPRLVGVFESFDIVCSGKLYRANEALKLGLLDQVVALDILADTTKKWVLGKPKRKPHLRWYRDFILLNLPLLRKITYLGVKLNLSRKIRENHYPAPFIAARAVLDATNPFEDGYERESTRLAETLVSKTAKNLIYVWVSSERQKKLGRPFENRLEQIRTIGIVGAGIMGTGIAGYLANHGHSVILCDSNEEALRKAESSLINSVQGSITYTKELEKFANVDFVIEAVVEDLAVKQSVLRKVAEIVPSHIIITSNTSSISITELGKSVLLPGRFVGMHFFNPVKRMPVVEVVRGRDSADTTVMTVVALVSQVKKIPIIVDDAPGFLINRLLARYLIKSLRLAVEGYDVHQIEKNAIEFGFPMGPFRLMDHVGLDICASVSSILHENLGSRFMPPETIYRFIEEGFLGQKTGKGFYIYDGSKKPSLNSFVRTIFPCSKPLTKDEYEARCLFALADETMLAYEQKIAGLPSPEAEAQVDLGSVFGFGFPAFTGGVMCWTKSLHRGRVKHLLGIDDQAVSEYFKSA
ncbi:MAG: 3-hydroxyacyl-CoA dehydrogenase NAD-binding domain-containing protein [Thermoplasmatales archaeon]